MSRSRIAGSAVLALPVTGTVMVVLLALVHDVLPAHPPRAVSWLVAGGILVGLTGLVGTEVAARLRRGPGLRRMAAVLTGAALGAVPVLGPLVALLPDDVAPVARLAWTLGEEDNAQIIGVAREIVVDGPGGGVMSRQYGTGFMVLATTLMRMFGRPDPSLDPRLLAIHAFTLSTALAVLTITVGVALIVLLSLHVGRRPRAHGLLALALATAAATVAALAVTVVLPMRTGFLTFTWGMAWVVLGASLVPLLARAGSARLLAVIGTHVVATAVLTVRSWPFIAAAAVPAVVILGSRLPWSRMLRRVRARPLVAAVVGLVGAGGIGAYLWNGLLGEVVSYGLDAFTIGASGIVFDDRLRGAVVVGVLAVGVLLWSAGWRSAVAVAGPAVAGLASWLALTAAAQVLTGGEFNYGSTKLLYGIVGVATATAVPVLLTAWSGRPPAGAAVPVAAAGAAAALLWGSVTVGEVTGWSARLEPAEPPHAVAMILAIERTNPDLPVRCRPEPGTVVTPDSRWAAYFCVRWVEDALNDRDRSRGYRGAYLDAPDGTFDPIVAQATVDGHYGFAYILPLGPGWFGWDGRS